MDRPTYDQILSDLVNALQTATLTAEQLEQTAPRMTEDASTLTRSLRRATAALEQLRADGGAR